MEIKGLKINIIGDSITFGACIQDSLKNRFTAILEKEHGAIIRNYGWNGTRIAAYKEIVNGPSFCERYSEMDGDADLVFVFGGTNDYGHALSPVGRPGDKSQDTFYGACNTLFKGLIEKYPTAVVAVITPLHRKDEDVPNAMGARLKTYVDIIRAAAEEYSLPVLDLWKMSGLQPNIKIIRDKYVPDGLHPNEAGHRILASRIAAFIKSL